MPKNKPDLKKASDNSDAKEASAEHSQALRQAMLKLKASGMLTHVPDDLETAIQTPSPTDDLAPTAVASEEVLSAWDDDLASDQNDDSTAASTPTIPMKPDLAGSSSQVVKSSENKPPIAITEHMSEQTPWALQQFFDGDIDLEQELLKRHPILSAMTTIKFRELGKQPERQVATLITQDGNQMLIIDADQRTKVVQLSFKYGTMITFRYVLTELSPAHCDRWLELMRREKDGMAFLWNERRWQNDYLICVSRELTTYIFAFSPNHFESSVRLTNDVTEKLLNWLQAIWYTEPPTTDEDDPPILTW